MLWQGWKYEGEWQRDLWHGNGTLTTPHPNASCSTVYTGEWEGGLRHGRGVLVDCRGASVYRGAFERDQPSGFGALFTLSGEGNGDSASSGNGGGDSEGEKSNVGSLLYEGQWLNGLRSGLGRGLWPVGAPTAPHYYRFSAPSDPTMSTRSEEDENDVVGSSLGEEMGGVAADIPGAATTAGPGAGPGASDSTVQSSMGGAEEWWYEGEWSQDRPEGDGTLSLLDVTLPGKPAIVVCTGPFARGFLHGNRVDCRALTPEGCAPPLRLENYTGKPSSYSLGHLRLSHLFVLHFK